jgi:hypothetical protein
MSQILAGAFVVFACAVTYLVLTTRVKFPLLFEVGMGLVAIGAVLIGEAVDSNVGGLAMLWRGVPLTMGALLILASGRREKRKRIHTEPRHLDVEDWQHVHGRGKK